VVVDPGYVLDELERAPTYEGQLAVRRTMPEREARYGRTSRPLDAQVAEALHRQGISRLWSHQAAAVDLLRDGHNVAVATGTASGKTLCYHLPVFEALLAGSTALYLSPTKALSGDQLRQIARFELDDVKAETYDGDTPSSSRASIRRSANLVLTNPDMLHIGILPHHELWRRFLSRLAFVVVDEAHVLRGVFGSHAALVLRRLRRVTNRYGATPAFAFTSATIGNPAEHASALSGLEVEAITEDGSPSGVRHMAFWNPPYLDGEETGRRRSSNMEAAALLSSLVGAGAQTIAFSKARVSAELVARYARERLDGSPDLITAYRAGYLASERHEIENGLREGRYAGVSATNALELGIDIGGLDAVILNAFPGTVASARQQAGRAGRNRQPSLGVIVPADEPLDQYYVAHPNDFFAKPHEAALIDPSNPWVCGPHLGCAAYELPLHLETDAQYFGEWLEPMAAELTRRGDTRARRGRLYWARAHPPAPSVDIRSAGGDTYRIVEPDTGRVVGTVDSARAPVTVHPGAIYLHQGESYRVRDLVQEDLVALVEKHEAEEYTQAKTDIDLVVRSVEDESRLGSCGLLRGVVEVTEQVIGYQRRRLRSGEVIEVRELDMPPEVLVTRAVWYTIPQRALEAALHGLEGEAVLLGSLHAAEHAAIGILPVFAMCDRWDIGGLSTNLHPDTGLPSIFIYDGYPMGAGLSYHAFDVARDHLGATLEHLRNCACEDGCPACVQSPKCGNWNEPLHKRGARRVLELILG
jgi:DEAD/DEAH box helicase domain-containing protein